MELNIMDNVAEGDLIQVYVQAILGPTEKTNYDITYSAKYGDGKINMVCYGSTLNFECTMLYGTSQQLENHVDSAETLAF